MGINNFLPVFKIKSHLQWLCTWCIIIYLWQSLHSVVFNLNILNITPKKFVWLELWKSHSWFDRPPHFLCFCFVCFVLGVSCLHGCHCFQIVAEHNDTSRREPQCLHSDGSGHFCHWYCSGEKTFRQVMIQIVVTNRNSLSPIPFQNVPQHNDTEHWESQYLHPVRCVYFRHWYRAGEIGNDENWGMSNSNPMSLHFWSTYFCTVIFEATS